MKAGCHAPVSLMLMLSRLVALAQISEAHSFSGLNRLIPDGNWAGLSDVQSVTTAVNQLTGLRVKLQVIGEFNGDLYGYVRHITSTATNFCVLVNRLGRTAAAPAGYAGTGLDVTFDDFAANGNIHGYQSLTNPPAGSPLIGSWQPDGRRVDPAGVLDTSAVSTTLSTFNGTDANGEWMLFLADVDKGGTNMLASWELDIAGRILYHGVDLSDPAQALADSDGDGLSNLMEYALGTDPTNSGDANSEMGICLTDTGGSKYLTMKFRQRVAAGALGLQYFPEVSGDRQTWFSDGNHVQVLSTTPDLDNQFNWVAVQDTTLITVAAPRFVRLRVVQNSIESASEVRIGAASLLQGNSGAGSALSLFSLRMVNPVEYAGRISSLGPAALIDTNGDWADGQFNGANGSFYLEFTNGWMADITDTDAPTKTLSLADDLRGSVVPGDSYRIRRHFTVASLFGATNSVGLYPGLNPAAGDNVLLQIPETQQAMTIFYYNAGPYAGWYRADYSAASNQVIYPEQGLMVRRKVAADLSVYAVGLVKSGPTIARVLPGYNLVGTLSALASLTVSNLSLYTGDAVTGLASGLNPASADNLLLLQPNGAVATLFYYQDALGNHGWYDAAYQPAGNRLISPGSAFFISRKPPRSAFDWTIPVE